MGSDLRFVELSSLLYEAPRNGLYKGKEFQGRGHRWIKMTEVFANNFFLDQVTELLDVTESEIERFSCIQGDLLFGRTSLILEGVGECLLVEGVKDLPIFESNLFRIRFDLSKACPRFYFYYFKSKLGKQLIQKIAKQTAAASITASDLIAQSVPFFELQKAKKISELIYQFDNKITLNRQLNQTLEQMAQALFKSWFVDFDPVIDNALAAGNVIPDDLQDRAERRQLQLAKADHKPLPENIRKLFPSEFELTESLGWVPKGWGEVGLNKFIKFVNGKSKTSDDSGVFPLYGANGEIGRSNVEKFRNAIIIGRVGAYCGAIEFCLGGFWASDNTIVATPLIDEQSIGYVLYLLKYLELNQFAGGAAQPLLNQSVLGSIKFPDVSNEIVKLFNNISSGFLASIWQRKKEMDDLAQLRDTLLPKLISGELRIPEVQAQLEEALV